MTIFIQDVRERNANNIIQYIILLPSDANCIGDNNGDFEKDPNEPRHFVIVGDCKWISGEEALEQVFVADDSSEDEHSAKFSAKSSEKSFG